MKFKKEYPAQYQDFVNYCLQILSKNLDIEYTEKTVLFLYTKFIYTQSDAHSHNQLGWNDEIGFLPRHYAEKNKLEFQEIAVAKQDYKYYPEGIIDNHIKSMVKAVYQFTKVPAPLYI